MALLHAIYAIVPNSCSYSLPKAGQQWSAAQTVPDLLNVAAASHGMGCTWMLANADQALMKQSCAGQSASNQLSRCRQAWQLGLVGTQQSCMVAIIKLLPDMSKEELAMVAELVPCILSAANKDAIEMFEEMRVYRNMWYPHASYGEMLNHLVFCQGVIRDRIPSDDTQAPP